MAPPKKGSTPTSFADSYSFASVPKPFKNPYYQRDAKRHPSYKQILGKERERIDKLASDEREVRSRGEIPVEPVQKEVATYATVEAPPSLLPMKKYCDVTGLEASYIEPKSTLRYHNVEVYEVVKSFGPSVIQSYLSVRGQAAVLR